MKQIHPANRGVDAVLYLGDVALGGQKNATISRRMNPINITNKITGEWSESLAGIKSWTLTCSGMFIKNQECFDILENAFKLGSSINVKLTDGNKIYRGSALITSFPVATVYNDTYTYNLIMIGSGELVHETDQSGE